LVQHLEKLQGAREKKKRGWAGSGSPRAEPNRRQRRRPGRGSGLAWLGCPAWAVSELRARDPWRAGPAGRRRRRVRGGRRRGEEGGEPAEEEEPARWLAGLLAGARAARPWRRPARAEVAHGRREKTGSGDVARPGASDRQIERLRAPPDLGFRGEGDLGGRSGISQGGGCEFVLGETLIGWFGRWGSIYRQVGWPVDANALCTPLVRPAIAFVTAVTPYGLRFR
jgi:hypothetical protein